VCVCVCYMPACESEWERESFSLMIVLASKCLRHLTLELKFIDIIQ